MKVDTGSGSTGVDEETRGKLGLKAIGLKTIGGAVGRPQEVPVYAVNVSIDGASHFSRALGLNRPVIGMDVLKRFTTIVKGADEVTLGRL